MGTRYPDCDHLRRQTGRGPGRFGRSAAEADTAPTVGGEGGTPEAANTPPIGDEGNEDIPRAADLFEPATTAQVIFLQNVVPAIATVASFLLFRFVPIA